MANNIKIAEDIIPKINIHILELFCFIDLVSLFMYLYRCKSVGWVLLERNLAEPIIDPETGEILFDTMTHIDETKLKKLSEIGVTEFKIANDLAEGVDASIINAFNADADSLKLLKQTEEIEDENLQIAKVNVEDRKFVELSEEEIKQYL